MKPRLLLLLLALACGAAVNGCDALDEPDLEDRWTRLDIEGSNVPPGRVFTAGAQESVSVSAAITYRKIVTGFAVAELRASSTLTPADLVLYEEAPRLRMATDIDRLLQNSVSVGRATRAITGWDHLIQRIDFVFSAAVPSAADSNAAGLFLVCYLGSGEEIELQGGMDSLVVTPFVSTDMEILPVGRELTVGP